MRLVLAAAVTVIALPALGQDFPAPRNYWCSLQRADQYENGRMRFESGEFNDDRRPSLVTFPHPSDTELAGRAMSSDGQRYAYARLINDGIEQYMIHGVFDFSDMTLFTTRSTLFHTSDGGWVANAASFVSVCTEAQD